jgi:hypothetical protein
MALFDPSPGTPACAPPGWHPRQSGRVRRNRPRSIPRRCNKGEPCGSMSTPAPRSQGTKAPVKTLEVRDRRSPLTTWRMSRIAKGSYCRARCSSKQALAQIAKSGGLRFRSELPAVLVSGRAAGGVDANAGAFLPERGFVMRNRIDMDPKHSRAIVQEIGERLRAFLKEEPELPGSLRTQIDRLRELEEQSPSIIPTAEPWDKRRR